MSRFDGGVYNNCGGHSPFHYRHHLRCVSYTLEYFYRLRCHIREEVHVMTIAYKRLKNRTWKTTSRTVSILTTAWKRVAISHSDSFKIGSFCKSLFDSSKDEQDAKGPSIIFLSLVVTRLILIQSKKKSLIKKTARENSGYVYTNKYKLLFYSASSLTSPEEKRENIQQSFQGRTIEEGFAKRKLWCSYTSPSRYVRICWNTHNTLWLFDEEKLGNNPPGCSYLRALSATTKSWSSTFHFFPLVWRFCFICLLSVHLLILVSLDAEKSFETKQKMRKL